MAAPNTLENPLTFLDFLKKIMSDPDIGPLIDVTKIVRLPRYETALNAAIQHYKVHGDHTFIPKLLSPLKQSIYYTPVLSYVCDCASLTFSIVDGEIKFKKKELSEGADTPKRTLEQYLDGQQEDILGVTGQLPKPTKRITKDIDNKQKKKRKKPYLDMLDSRARLPGSFEGGKRR